VTTCLTSPSDAGARCAPTPRSTRAVTDHRVRFADRTDITDTDAEHVHDGDVVIWIVQAECQPPSYHHSAPESDDRYRFNVQKVQRAVVLTGELRDGAIHYLDHPDQRQGYLAFEAHSFGPNGLHDPLDEPQPEPEPEPVMVPAYEHDDYLPLDDDVQVIGSIYGPGHRGETQSMLREAWGES
jgi:hypothetical protein